MFLSALCKKKARERKSINSPANSLHTGLLESHEAELVVKEKCGFCVAAVQLKITTPYIPTDQSIAATNSAYQYLSALALQFY
jgi:hypothetical protein